MGAVKFNESTRGYAHTLAPAGKFPIVGDRIFDTLQAAQDYVDGNGASKTAIPGIYLSVIADGANNGAYWVAQAAGYGDAKVGILLKMGEGGGSSSGGSIAFADILNKPTTLVGYGITDAISYKNGINTSSAYKEIGYGHATTGWKTSGPAMVFGTSTYNLAMQCAIADADYVSLYLRMKYNGVEKGWDRVVTEQLLQQGVIAFDALAYKSYGDYVLHRNVDGGDTYLNYGAANSDQASLAVFGYNINFYAGVASSYTTYLQLSHAGTAIFFVPLTLNKGVTIPAGQVISLGNASLSYNSGSIVFSNETNSPNFPVGGTLAADPSASFRETCFGSKLSSYALRVMRPGNANFDGVATRWGAFLAISPGDTHGFIHFPAYANLRDQCYIGGGISDALTWKATLFHSDMSLIPKSNDTYSLGSSAYRWKEVHAVSIKIGDATISWDSSAGMLKIDKGVYSTGAITAGAK